MSQTAPNLSPIDDTAAAAPQGSVNAPAGWTELRQNDAIQFEEISLVTPAPQEPNWFLEMLGAIVEFFAAIFSPLGQMLAGVWPVLQWVLLAGVIAFALYLLARLVGPLSRRLRKDAQNAESEPEWQPDAEQSRVLLEDADRLAAQGRYDEATHLLLQRSVTHISDARPDWVEPSSTARELAALPALSEAARTAFGVIAQRVERSLFALRSLDKSDWDAAREAYASFALTRIGGDTADREVAA